MMQNGRNICPFIVSNELPEKKTELFCYGFKDFFHHDEGFERGGEQINRSGFQLEETHDGNWNGCDEGGKLVGGIGDRQTD